MLQITAEILSEIKLLNKNLAWLRNRDREVKKAKGLKSVWVTVTEVKLLTGWSNNYMRKARENGFVNYRKENGRIRYDLSSIHEMHHKK